MIRARLPRKAGQSKRKHTATPPRSLRAATSGTQKQNNGRVCNFFAIRNCSSSPIAVQDVKTADNQPYSNLFVRSRDGKESLIAKKLQKRSKFCFRDGRTNLMGRSAQRVSPHSPHSYRTSRSQQGHTNAGAKGKVLLFFANSQTKARTIPVNATNRT